MKIWTIWKFLNPLWLFHLVPGSLSLFTYGLGSMTCWPLLFWGYYLSLFSTETFTWSLTYWKRESNQRRSLFMHVGYEWKPGYNFLSSLKWQPNIWNTSEQKLQRVKHDIALHKNVSVTCYKTSDKNCSGLNHGKLRMNDSLNVDCELLQSWM